MGGDYKGAKFSGKREMYPAICDKCGAACSVPFKPSGNKPVYCSNCFEKTDSREGQYRKPDSGVRRYGGHETRRGSNYRGSNQPHPSDRQNAEITTQLERLNEKLDQIIALLKPMATPEVEVKKKAKSK